MDQLNTVSAHRTSAASSPALSEHGLSGNESAHVRQRSGWFRDLVLFARCSELARRCRSTHDFRTALFLVRHERGDRRKREFLLQQPRGTCKSEDPNRKGRKDRSTVRSRYFPHCPISALFDVSWAD